MSAHEFPIVGIGASARGLDAFHAYFDHMPADCNMAFIMVFASAGGSEKPAPGNPPPHALVTLVDGRLAVRLPQEEERVFRPIDGFFDALAAALGDQAVGVVLSATGSDGALGLKAIKEAGGLTGVQGSGGTAPQYGDMPAGAIATGAADLIAPVEDIPKDLLRLRGGRALWVRLPEGPASTDAARLGICAILRDSSGMILAAIGTRRFCGGQRRMQMRHTTATITGMDQCLERRTLGVTAEPRVARIEAKDYSPRIRDALHRSVDRGVCVR